MFSILYDLIKVANRLDKSGLYKESDELENIVKIAISQSSLIKALKEDNADETIAAFHDFISRTSDPAGELGMTQQEFRSLFNAIKNKHMDTARNLMNVGKSTGENIEELDIGIYNPITGEPWESEPKFEQKPDDRDFIGWLRGFHNDIKSNGGTLHNLSLTPGVVDGFDGIVGYIVDSSYIESLGNIGRSLRIKTLDIRDKKHGIVFISVFKHGRDDNFMFISFHTGSLPDKEEFSKEVREAVEI